MKFPILVSYAYARKDEKEFAAYAESPHIEVLLDCGAFTAKNSGQDIRLEDYCGFLDRWGKRLFRYLALDKVGDPAVTESNLKEMLRAGYKPVPVHVLGDDERRMDELFGISDYVALAGLRRPHKGHCPKEYIKAKMKWARGRDVHWLGYVKEDMFSTFRPYSCDSASWGAPKMWGKVHVYYGRGRWVHSVPFRERVKLLRNPEVMRVIEGLGFSPKELNDERHWRRNIKAGFGPETCLSEIVTADSWVRYVIDCYKRWGVKVFLATSLADDLYSLKGAIDRHADKLNLGHDPVRIVPQLAKRPGKGGVPAGSSPASVPCQG
jgi:hypothetical protein